MSRKWWAAAERFGGNEEPESTVNYADLEVLMDAESLTAGRQIYESPRNLCTTCHGQNAQGLVGPNLNEQSLEARMRSGIDYDQHQERIPPAGNARLWQRTTPG